MNVQQILEKLSNWHETDLVTLFSAIENAKLSPTNYSLGEAKRLNDLKEIIKKSKEIS